MRAVLPLFALLLFVGGCRGSDPAGDSRSKPYAGNPARRGAVGLSVLTMSNPFFGVIAQNLQSELGGHGYEVIIVSGDFDVAKQQNQVKDFIVRKVSAIVLTPCDSKSIGPAIKEANQAGIPIFTADIKSLAPDAKVVCHIATDNYGGGKEAAKVMIEALGEGGGKVLILDFPVVESCQQRVKGFKDDIAVYNQTRTSGKIDIVSVLDGGGQKDKGYNAAQDALQAHADLAGIFAINDPSALGARAALEKAGKADQVKIIAFDGQPEGKRAIKEGKIYADPIQFPDRIGRETAQAIVKHFAGEEVPPEILIPTMLYRKADAEKDPALK